MDTDIRQSVQETLDELLREHLIPFALTAQKVSEEPPGSYVVPFYDSRIHSLGFSWTDHGSPIKETIRTAILDRVKGLVRPPTDWVRTSAF